VFLSEYTLNTALETTHDAGLIEFTVRVTSTYLKTFFKNWEDVMGKHTNIKMILQSRSAPRLEIREGISKIFVDSNLRILNPYTDEFDAVNLSCSLVISLEFELLNDTTLAGKIGDMQITVDSMQVFFMNDLTVDIMNSQVQALANPFKVLINTQLIQGYQLPLPRGLQQDLSLTRMYTYDHFILIESDPQIQQKVEERVSDLVNSLQI
jgi:hypothetical protein